MLHVGHPLGANQQHERRGSQLAALPAIAGCDQRVTSRVIEDFKLRRAAGHRARG